MSDPRLIDDENVFGDSPYSHERCITDIRQITDPAHLVSGRTYIISSAGATTGGRQFPSERVQVVSVADTYFVGIEKTLHSERPIITDTERRYQLADVGVIPAGEGVWNTNRSMREDGLYSLVRYLSGVLDGQVVFSADLALDGVYHLVQAPMEKTRTNIKTINELAIDYSGNLSAIAIAPVPNKADERPQAIAAVQITTIDTSAGVFQGTRVQSSRTGTVPESKIGKTETYHFCDYGLTQTPSGLWRADQYLTSSVEPVKTAPK